jgi:transcriptional regulator with XRE-family HTH domain
LRGKNANERGPRRGCSSLRRERRHTIDDFAFEAEIHPTYLSAIERGIRNPTWIKLCALADALGVTMGSLIGDAEAEAHIAARVREARLELEARADRRRDIPGSQA